MTMKSIISVLSLLALSSQHAHAFHTSKVGENIFIKLNHGILHSRNAAAANDDHDGTERITPSQTQSLVPSSTKAIAAAASILFATTTALSGAAWAVSGGGMDYANIDLTGQDFSNGNYKGKDFTQVCVS